MTRHGGLCNTYHTRCHSIGAYDMVQEYVPLRASFIIQVIWLVKTCNCKCRKKTERHRQIKMQFSYLHFKHPDILPTSDELLRSNRSHRKI